MRLNADQLYTKLKQIGVVYRKTPISYVGFKNRTTIHRTPNRVVVYLGLPKSNLFAFYPPVGNDAEVLKNAYDLFVTLAKGDATPYKQRLVGWGNCGYPQKIGDNLKAV